MDENVYCMNARFKSLGQPIEAAAIAGAKEARLPF